MSGDQWFSKCLEINVSVKCLEINVSVKSLEINVSVKSLEINVSAKCLEINVYFYAARTQGDLQRWLRSQAGRVCRGDSLQEPWPQPHHGPARQGEEGWWSQEFVQPKKKLKHNFEFMLNRDSMCQDFSLQRFLRSLWVFSPTTFHNLSNLINRDNHYLDFDFILWRR